MRPMMRRMKRSVSRVLTDRRGFTLVEMLIVLAIIGILAAIAVPNLAGMTAAAKRKACEANQKTLEAAAGMYYADTGEWPATTTGENGTSSWMQKLVDAGYLDALVKCPVSGSSESYSIDENGKVTCDHAAPKTEGGA